MRLSRLLALMVGLALLPLESFAQDDFLVPLTPEAEPAAKKKKAKKTRKVKRPTGVTEEVEEDDVLAPLVAKTELQLKVPGAENATATIDGKDVGPVTAEPFEIEPGEHIVVVKRPGYADAIRRVRAPEGQRTDLSVTLEAVAGVLNVVANVKGARVAVDGKDEGAVPLKEHLLVPGSHEVKVAAPGYRPDRQRIQVRAGKDYNLEAKLRPEGEAVAAADDRPEATDLTPDEAEFEPVPLVAAAPPPAAISQPQWYQRWYVWAGSAVLLGAVAGGVVVASQPPDLSSNPNTSVCNGTCDGVVGTPGFR